MVTATAAPGVIPGTGGTWVLVEENVPACEISQDPAPTEGDGDPASPQESKSLSLATILPILLVVGGVVVGYKYLGGSK